MDLTEAYTPSALLDLNEVDKAVSECMERFADKLSSIIPDSDMPHVREYMLKTPRRLDEDSPEPISFRDTELIKLFFLRAGWPGVYIRRKCVTSESGVALEYMIFVLTLIPENDQGMTGACGMQGASFIDDLRMRGLKWTNEHSVKLMRLLS